MAANFAVRLDATAREHADRTAVRGSGGALSYRALDRRASGVARALADKAVAAGDRVALTLPNGWPFAAAFLGALKLGAVVAPLDPRLTAEERTAVLDDLRPRIVVDAPIAAEAEFPTVNEAVVAAISAVCNQTGMCRL